MNRGPATAKILISKIRSVAFGLTLVLLLPGFAWGSQPIFMDVTWDSIPEDPHVHGWAHVSTPPPATIEKALAKWATTRSDLREDEKRLLEIIEDTTWELARMEVAEREARLARYEEGLQAFITDFPASDLKDDAAILVANAVERAGDIHRIRSAYQRVIDEFAGGTFGELSLETHLFNIPTGYRDERGFVDWSKAPKKPETDVYSHMAIARTYQELNRYPEHVDDDKALEAYRRVVAQFPDSPYAGYAQWNLGHILNGQHLRHEARGEYQKVIDNYPENTFLVMSAIRSIGAMMTAIGEWTIMELYRDMLATMCSADDYLAESGLHDMTFRRWFEPGGLTVYAHRTEDQPLSVEDSLLVTEALRICEAALPGILTFRLLEDPADDGFGRKQVDIEVVLTSQAPGALGAGSNGITQITGSVNSIRRLGITIYNVGQRTQSGLLKTMLHEFGHGLGLGHSFNTDDIMFYTTHRVELPEFSDRDTNTLRGMYEHPVSGLKSWVSRLDLGQIGVGKQTVAQLRVSNLMNRSLLVTGMDLSGETPDEFDVSWPHGEMDSGLTAALSVYCTPDSPGGKSAVLSISHTGVGSPTNVVLTATAVDPPTVPVLSYPPLKLYFYASVGLEVGRTVVLRNEGKADLEVTDVDLEEDPADEFAVSARSFTLAPGDSQIVRITFAPKEEGERSTSLRILSNSEDSPHRLEATAHAVVVRRPRIATSATDLVFTPVEAGNSSRRTFTVGNHGDSELSFTLLLAGADAAEFALSPESGKVGPNDQAEVAVVFTPTTYETKSAHIEVGHNAEGRSISIPLSVPSLTTVPGVMAPRISLSTFGLSFIAIVGEQHESSVDIHNLGTGDVVVHAIDTEGGVADQFSVSRSEFSVSRGDSQTVVVAFRPRSSGIWDGSLVLHHNGPESPTRITLRGYSTAVSARLELSAESLEFEQTPVGESRQKSVSITSTGDVILNVSDVALSGPDALAFSVWPTTARLHQSERAAVTVTFIPNSEGPVSAEASISHNGPGSPAVVRLTGEGTAQTVIEGEGPGDNFWVGNGPPGGTVDVLAQDPTGSARALRREFGGAIQELWRGFSVAQD